MPMHSMQKTSMCWSDLQKAMDGYLLGVENVKIFLKVWILSEDFEV